jgi:O-antigen/teichoic acid export membrane protein
MLGELRKLLRETAVYGLATVVGRFLNVFLLPLYTHALAPEEYGVIALVFSTIAFLNVVYDHGLDFAAMRHAEEEGAKAFTTAFWSLGASSLLLSTFLFLFSGPLWRLAGLPPGLESIAGYAAWILALDTACLVPFARLRMENRASTYASVKVANIVLNLVLNYVFLVKLGFGVRGVFLAGLLTSSMTFAALAPLALSDLSSGFDRALHRKLLRFGLPLVPAGLASMAVQLIDRPILQAFAGERVVGLYQANFRIAVVMMMVVNMFDAAWRPFFLQRAGKPDAPALLARVMTYFVALVGLLFLASSLLIPYIVALPLGGGRTLIHESYWAGLAIVPIITLGYVFNGITINLLAPVTLAKKSERIAMATMVGAAVSVVANFALIPRWGMLGSAWALFSAYLTMAATLYWLGRSIYPVPYEWRRLARVALSLASIGLCARALGLGMEPNNLLLRLVLLLAYPTLLLASGFLRVNK